MVDKQLRAYVQNMLKQGYSREAVRAQLVRYGYSASLIDEALARSHTWIIMVLVLVFLVVVIAVAMLFSLQAEEEATVFEAAIDLDNDIIGAGNVLQFTLSIESSTPVFGRVLYRLVDVQSAVQASKEASISTQRVRDSISAPSKEGVYTLVAEVKAGGHEVTASAPFKVVLEDSGFTWQRTGPPSPEEGKRISDIVVLAEEDAGRARALCLEFENQQAIDQCLLESALTASNELFCPDIKDPDKRDTCYFNLMLILGKQELCGKITHHNLRGTCIQI